MKKRVKTEINLQIEESVAIRSHSLLRGDCPQCQTSVRMLPANEAAIIARMSAREIYRLVETGGLHFIEDQNGLLYVCSESLRNSVSFQEGEPL